MTNRFHRCVCLLLLGLVTGCAATSGRTGRDTGPPTGEPDNASVLPKLSTACPRLERNLTVNWAQRRYWCHPALIKPPQTVAADALPSLEPIGRPARRYTQPTANVDAKRTGAQAHDKPKPPSAVRGRVWFADHIGELGPEGSQRTARFAKTIKPTHRAIRLYPFTLRKEARGKKTAIADRLARQRALTIRARLKTLGVRQPIHIAPRNPERATRSVILVAQ